MDDTNERIINAWVELSAILNNNRLVTDMPYNEAIICRYLIQHPNENITATTLCAKTRIKKSQMNRTLIAMFDKGLIYRENSQQDKRHIFIRFNPEKRSVYDDMHKKTLALVTKLLSDLGTKRTEQLLKTLDYMVEAACLHVELLHDNDED